MASSFYLWSHWKAKVCAETFQTVKHFQECAIDACNSVTSDSAVCWLTGYLVFMCVSVTMVDTLNICFLIIFRCVRKIAKSDY